MSGKEFEKITTISFLMREYDRKKLLYVIGGY